MKFVVKKEFSPVLNDYVFRIYGNGWFITSELTFEKAKTWVDSSDPKPNFEPVIVYEKEINNEND